MSFLNLTANVDTGATQSTIPVTVGTAASAGNTLIGIVKASLGCTVSAVSDTQGNTWVVDESDAIEGAATLAAIRSVLATGLGTSDVITVTLSGSSSYNMGAIICEYSGTYTTDVKYSLADSSPSLSLAYTASTSTAEDNELVVAGIGISGTTSAGSITVSTSVPEMTVRATAPPSPGIVNSAMADGTSSGIITPAVTWTWTELDEGPVGIVVSYTGGSSPPAPSSSFSTCSPVAAFVASGLR